MEITELRRAYYAEDASKAARILAANGHTALADTLMAKNNAERESLCTDRWHLARMECAHVWRKVAFICQAGYTK